jgi:hypothetical protein
MSNKQLIVYKTPENFCVHNAKFFLEDIEDVFELDNSEISDVFFKVMQTKKIDLLGLLLIYKFLNYTVKRRCFANPETDLKSNKTISNELKRIGFQKLVDENFTIKDPDDTKTEYSEMDGFFLAPIVLERGGAKSDKENIIETKIRNYYNDTQISQGLLQCIGEISSNFQEHAVNDTKSVLVARGNKSQIEIACADNGDGIISTLMPSLNENYAKRRYEVIKKSIEENITSKAKEGHMGCGLWIVNQYVTNTKGVMYIFSQDGYLMNKKGIIKCGQSPFWRGTIVYVNMPLSNKEVFSRIMKEKEKNIELKHPNIELNIISK